MLKVGAFGGQLELEAVSQHFKCPVEIYLDHDTKGNIKPNKIYRAETKHARNQPIQLLYSGNCHYDSLISS